MKGQLKCFYLSVMDHLTYIAYRLTPRKDELVKLFNIIQQETRLFRNFLDTI